MFIKKALIVAIFLFFIFNCLGTDACAENKAENKILILLYYLNTKMVLQEFPFEPEKAVFPVYREIPKSATLIRDTIEFLISEELTKQEEELGFITEFPHPGFKLIGLDLKKDGTLVLEFTEIFGFTTGGASRILVIREQIEKTALQFAAVKRIEFYPESLFQP
ncbi:MAG: GerMN domain-containing protein [Candidatus Nealsonbacteria bacterium]|nr:GerMN domain-containing protein [Candidatus Nealsonbacteria bacterium]